MKSSVTCIKHIMYFLQKTPTFRVCWKCPLRLLLDRRSGQSMTVAVSSKGLQVCPLTRRLRWTLWTLTHTRSEWWRADGYMFRMRGLRSIQWTLVSIWRLERGWYCLVRTVGGVKRILMWLARLCPLIHEMERTRRYNSALACTWNRGRKMSIRNDLPHTLISFINKLQMLISVASGWKGDVTLAALIGRLQVVIARSVFRGWAQAEVLEAGHRVAGGSLRWSWGPAVLSRPRLTGCLALIGWGDVHHPP